MKTEFEKMRGGELYSFADAEVTASITHAQKLCARLRMMSIHDEDYREVIEELIPGIPKSSMICPPFHCDHGHGIILVRMCSSITMPRCSTVLLSALASIPR